MSAYSLLRRNMKECKLTTANMALLLGVEVQEFLAWEESAPPEIYVQQIRGINEELERMLKLKLLPKSQNELVVEGLIALSYPR